MIRLEGLTKRWGSKVAVDDLTADVLAGRVTGFLGPNGAGKSTTMRMILGLDRPSAGSALVDNRPYASLRQPLHHVGALLDAGQLNPGHTAEAHLGALAASNAIARSRVGDVLDLVGLGTVARTRIRTFSLGMRQRLGIAAALLGDPPILVLDEPVNGLDPEGVRWIRELMRSWAEEGRTVLVSSHLLSEMQDTADHLLLLSRGRLVADAPLAELISRPLGASVRVRTPRATELADHLAEQGLVVESTSSQWLVVAGTTTDRVGEVAHAAGIVVHELSSDATTLEQAYLELTSNGTEFAADPGRGVR